jgi:predicted RNA-binding protein
MALQATNADCTAAWLRRTPAYMRRRSAAGWAEYSANCYRVLGEVDAAGVAVAATSREMQTEAEGNLDRTARTQATVNDQEYLPCTV